MPRNISFDIIADAIVSREKDVTRRLGWGNLKAITRLWAVRNARSANIERLALIEVVSVASEPLNAITQDDVIREGFPDYSPQDFVDMLVGHYKITPDSLVNRIEFKYIESDGKPYFKCCKCKFTGAMREMTQKRVDAIESVNVCPKCGHDEYNND